MAKLAVGDAIPEFTLKDDEGADVARADLLGEGPLVLYFYPRDDTPGCTVESCTFRDTHEDFADAGARVVGVSADGVASHAAFKAKHSLPFTLLCDTDNALRRAFGVSSTLGILPGRVTYVVDSDGVIRHIFSSQLRVKTHVQEALRIVRELADSKD